MNARVKIFISKYILYVWIGYFLFPIFTGLLHYNYLPNENPLDDLSLYEILEYHEVSIGPTGAETAISPTLWKNRETGEVFADGDFSEHQGKEVWRIAKTILLYGFIGCIIYALGYEAKEKGKFIDGLQVALIVNAVVAVIYYLMAI